MRELYILWHCILSMFLVHGLVYSMETEPVSMLRSSQSEISTEHLELGGAASATEAFNSMEYKQELTELKLLMGVVVDGIVVKDHAVLLPGRAMTVPLPRAAQWINDAMDDACNKEYNGELIIDSNDPLIRECQIAQKRLWDFLASADLLASGTDNQEYKEMLHVNRMLRVGALVTQNEEVLKQCGRAPVTLPLPVKQEDDEVAVSGCCRLRRLLTKPKQKTKSLKK